MRSDCPFGLGGVNFTHHQGFRPWICEVFALKDMDLVRDTKFKSYVLNAEFDSADLGHFRIFVSCDFELVQELLQPTLAAAIMPKKTKLQTLDISKDL